MIELGYLIFEFDNESKIIIVVIQSDLIKNVTMANFYATFSPVMFFLLVRKIGPPMSSHGRNPSRN